jgi:D-arabinose 1-dehydrogenase-like Zn-dependent alcohol dehydrogenase
VRRSSWRSRQAALPHRGVPLADVNSVFDRMQRGAINGRMVLRCC